MSTIADVDDLESILQTVVHRSKTPGLQCLVVDRMATRFEYHGGAADLTTNRPMLAGTTMNGLLNESGTKYAYSNIGYWLLGPVVEQASGELFTSYVTQHVLRPLDQVR
jgi:CubicO group peptidase (beta-lactamase class C family)